MIEQTKILAELRDAVIANTAALTRIADAFETALLDTSVPMASAPEAAPVCAHPIESRINFGTTNGYEDFLCHACGFRSVAQGVGSHG